ncbi:T9SS type A sorting domain-containing protein [Marinoscillum furvescens]|uniref:Agarase n=1 Tax=Marinoscillum furvescens DSM 4134 TaxID=1122208 RepID=A0A3D9L418_MARFU|nr:T9SS type A sorting domain-containing protein [Marinoscillum furvescens]REE00199.1 agarase [Marinoscillum furvescens DSM 4134]
MQKRYTLMLLGSVCLGLQTQAQDTVDVNVHVKHAVNGYADFDRSRHIIFHEDIDGNEWESDQQKIDLYEGYDVYAGRNNGGIVWEWNNTKEDPNKAGWPSVDYMSERAVNTKNGYANKTKIHSLEHRYSNMMIGGQEHMYPHGQATRNDLVYAGHEATAEFYTHYLDKFFGTGGSTGKVKPRFLEVLNEPFVKANKLNTTRTEIARFHNVVAQRVKELNPEVMVGGYSAAHPMFEASDFNHWRNNWKMFIDVAGENMDFFSFHLYDNAPEGVDQMEAMTYRSGSNMQAIMDMINHYSYLRLGETKPWSVSEYGFLCSGCEDNSPYLEREDWYNLRSFNSMFMQILERQDQIVHSIPFFLLKANWAKPAGAEYNGYQARLMRELGELPGEPAHGGYIYTHLLKFFQFWVELNGTRIDTYATDPDVQVDGYVDGKNLFVLINTLEHADTDVVLNLQGISDKTLQKLTVKHLYADANEVPVLDTTYYTEAIDQLTIKNQATALLKYEFAEEVTLTEENNETTYFADQYFQPISANAKQTYVFSNVQLTEHGEAILRLGLGRDHGQSLKPTLLINGAKVEVPDDWRGFDQKTRDRFFGVIEVPVPHDVLKAENTVELTFPDNGGHLTSLALQVFNFSTEIARSKKVATAEVLNAPAGMGKLQVAPNPVHDSFVINRSEGTFRILDMSGKTYGQGQFATNGKLDVAHLPQGVYCLQVHSATAVENIRFIKQ